MTPAASTSTSSSSIELEEHPLSADPQRKWDFWKVVLVGIPAVAALATGAGAVWGLVYTGASVRAAEQGQITERYSTAVEQLGSADMYVRVGGVFALERLSRDSPPDQSTIVEVLSAYVLGRAEGRATPSCASAAQSGNALPLDIQAAVKVLARRDPAHDQGAQVRFPGRCLPGLTGIHGQLEAGELAEANLVAANLGGASLRGANLTAAVLACRDVRVADSCAFLERTDLRDAFLTDADLTGAHLLEARMENAVLVRARLARANLIKADLRGVHMVNAVLSYATGQDANFGRAEAAGARFDHAHLSGSDFADSNLSGSDFTGAAMFSARLSRTALRDANLSQAILIGADLSGADLTNANLTGADLSHANLTAANLTGVDLSSVKLTAATGVPVR